MLPQVLQLGSLHLYSYGILVAIGFFLAVAWPIRLGAGEGLPVARLEGLGFVIVLTGVVGSKLLTALDYPGFYSAGANQIAWNQFLARGGVFYGGFLLAVIASVVYCLAAGLPGWQVADCVAPGLALAQGLGRIGCFLGGCCWGRATDLPIGVTFTSELAHQITGVPLHVKLHPTQLYEAALVLLSIPLLLWLRKKKTFQGQVILFYVFFYAVARYFIEFLRGDPRGYYFHDMVSTSQLISLVLIPLAATLIAWRRKQPQEVEGHVSGHVRIGPGKVRIRAV